MNRRPTRCQSWRMSDKHHTPLCQPGTCFRCWQPCRNHLGSQSHNPNPGGQEWSDATSGQRRCRECSYLLAHNSLAWVRLALVSEPLPARQVMAVLAEDGDFTVALTATWQLQHRHEVLDPFAEVS